MLSEQKYLEILEFAMDNLSQGILIVDRNGQVLKCNPKYKELTNINPQGNNINSLIHEGILTESASIKVIECKKPLLMEQIAHEGTEHEFRLMTRALPMKNENGEIECVVDYFSNISEKEQLVEALNKATFQNERYELELKEIRRSDRRESSIIHRSLTMKNLLRQAEIIATTDSNVLLTGESGTGKGILAKYIQANSKRKEQAFFAINCGAIPETLFESELFGYEKGAFSGALASGKKGIVEYANEGTLFLDEIGDIPYSVQVKLLRFLQEGEFYRVGGTRPIRVDVRIIAATNNNLMRKIQEKEFREDLFYRLSVFHLIVPPLRDRRDDIPVLLDFFKKKINTKYNIQKEFTPNFVESLLRMPFWGNVRELENIVERSMILTPGNFVDVISMAENVRNATLHNRTIVKSSARSRRFVLHPEIAKKGGDIKNTLQNIEKQMMLEAVEVYKTTVALADHFGVHQSTISKKMKKYGIKLK